MNGLKIEPKKNLMEWIKALDEVREADWKRQGMTYKDYDPVTLKKGRKFVKIIDETSVWGFVCMYDGDYKGVPVKKGDLLKPASWASPAKHSRGNIFDGTAQFSYYGPVYIK